MRSLPVLVRVYLAFVLFSLGGTALQVFGGLDPGPIAPVAAVLTLALGVMAVMSGPTRTSPPAPISTGLERGKLWASVAVLVLGIVAEICGLYTGLPFGQYRYTDAWWPTIPLPGGHVFPVMLPFAWVLIVVGATVALSRWFDGIRLGLMVGLLASAIDFFKEPVLTQALGYWKWTDPNWPLGEGLFGVPLLNALGWFVVATLGALTFEAVRHSPLLRPHVPASDSLGGGGEGSGERSRRELPSTPQSDAGERESKSRAATAVLAGHVLLMSGIGAMRGFPWMIAISVLAIAVIGWSAHRTPGPLVESQR
ncbi:MAG: carotenoid biosynthesis protein [Fimbriimonadaceae bacterium]|nr:carotenoid biosynthesis protein [Fimbriimonadaceae bacterium]